MKVWMALAVPTTTLLLSYREMPSIGALAEEAFEEAGEEEAEEEGAGVSLQAHKAKVNKKGNVVFFQLGFILMSS